LDQKRDFFQDVFQVVELIPKGRVTSYGAIAKYLGANKSSRVVGYAMNASHTNPIPIPAHRVVNRKGLLTGKMHFPTSTAMQERLEAEGIVIIEDQIQDFDTCYWDPSIELKLD
jgi:methylated-DNA-protein-cysteine methyltransferase related protein